jgi:hypothetical protein
VSKAPLAALLAVAIALGFAAPGVQGATCKEPITTKSRSAAKGSDQYRERRARGNAIKHWRRAAQKQYGFTYRFWSRSQGQKVECSGTAKSRLCVVTATPCSLF